jgi:hypothetical protein
MKYRIIDLFLLLFSGICFSQNTIHVKKTTENFYLGSTQSVKGLLYKNIENEFIFSIGNIHDIDITLLLADTSDIILQTVILPVEIRTNLELDIDYAAQLGAFKPNGTTDREKYKNTPEVFWYKRYKIFPKKESDFKFYLSYQSDSGLVLYTSPVLKCIEIPVPTLQIISIDQLVPNGKLLPTYDKDLKQGAKWFEINQFKLSVYGKKDNLLYSGFCYGNFITPEMALAVLNKKTKFVKIEKIESDKYNFPAIELKKK